MPKAIKRYLFLLCCMLLPLRAMAGGTVLFLYDGKNEHHLEYVEEGERQLQQLLTDVKVIRRDQSEDAPWTGSEKGRSLVVTVGAAAAFKAAKFRLPTLNTLLTERSFESLAAYYTNPRSAVYLEQSIERQLLLIKETLPSRLRLTVLLSEETLDMKDTLNSLSRRVGLSMQFVIVKGDEDIDKLFADGLLADDTLVLLPDPQVVNRRTVKPLVLGSYRKGIPLVGYSQALVKAGALMAVYSPLSSLEHQMLTAVGSYLESGVLPAPRHAEDFEISVNYQLARALRLSLPSEAELKRRLLEQLQ